MSKEIQQPIIMDSSNFNSCIHLKPQNEKDQVLGFIPSQNSVLCVIDDDNKKDEVTVGIIDQEEKKKEMVKQVISEGFHVNSLITTNDDTSSVLMVKMNNKEDSEEPTFWLENGVKKNQEPVGKGSTEFWGPFIAEQKKEISSKDSAKDEVCQVHSLTPSISQFENVVVKIINSESSSSRIEDKQDEVFQVKDVITGDEHVILVVETTQDDFSKAKSISPSKYLAGDLLLDKKKTTCQELMTGSGETNWWGKWGEFSVSRSGSNGMLGDTRSTCIVNGNGCAREEMMGSIALSKRRARICSDEFITQPEVVRQEKCSMRRKYAETGLKKDVLSRFVEARNVFCQKKWDMSSKQSYSREKMEALRFKNSYQQRQIWQEIYTGLGPVVAKELNLLAEDRQNGKAITDQQQPQQHHHHPQQHHQHPRNHQQHHQYLQKPRQHHQYPQQKQQQQHHQQPKKPPQHHHHHNHHQHQLAGVHRENTSILGAGTAMGRPIHLRINMKNARTNCYVPYVQYIPVYYSMSH
ncbi:hypothetical protein MKX01_004006 [Papaver californicum]|nr:hypothetical protein MKX01_004006 [Papaver californicum]